MKINNNNRGKKTREREFVFKIMLCCGLRSKWSETFAWNFGITACKSHKFNFPKLLKIADFSWDFRRNFQFIKR